jgi:prepilin-type N-terminal cleavage/methylation domain-containing protein
MKLKTEDGKRAKRGFTLMEVAIASGISGLMIGGIIFGYVQSTNRAEWSAYSLAAQSLAMQRLEQARAAGWDELAFPKVDELVAANFGPKWEVLDIPRAGTNVVRATNYTTITQISVTPPLRMVRVDCVWPFFRRGLFTNTVVTYRSPAQ